MHLDSLVSAFDDYAPNLTTRKAAGEMPREPLSRAA
jgi:hypothetical protein